MRAGTLSDPRVILLLRRHFVSATTTLLTTPELFCDPRDRAFFEGLKQSEDERARSLNLQGGVKTILFSPEGRVLALPPPLWWMGGDRADFLYRRKRRKQPDVAVEKFFEAAAVALRAVRGELPEDFERIRKGTDGELAELAKAPIPADVPRKGESALRVWTRADAPMYDALVGRELVGLTPKTESALVPDAEQAVREWPQELVLGVARALVPRGHVYARPGAGAVKGAIRSELVAGESGVARITGRLEIEPPNDETLGRRGNARKPFRLVLELRGELRFDRATGRLTSVCFASEGECLEYRHPVLQQKRYRYGAAAELLPRR